MLGVHREEGRQELCTGKGEERKLGADHGACRLGVGGKAKGAGVWKAFEAGPGLFGGDAAKFEDLVD